MRAWAPVQGPLSTLGTLPSASATGSLSLLIADHPGRDSCPGPRADRPEEAPRQVGAGLCCKPEDPSVRCSRPLEPAEHPAEPRPDRAVAASSRVLGLLPMIPPSQSCSISRTQKQRAADQGKAAAQPLSVRHNNSARWRRTGIDGREHDGGRHQLVRGALKCEDDDLGYPVSAMLCCSCDQVAALVNKMQFAAM
jgi:hypothetical protein